MHTAPVSGPAPALAAVSAFPHLHGQVARAITLQADQIVERASRFVARPELVAALDAQIAAGGLLAVDGESGSGVTSLFCHLAATRPYAIWLAEVCPARGLEALCAQLIALHGLPVSLVPPAAGRDASALEALLAEAGARRPAGDPLVVLIAGAWAPDDQAPLPPPFPAALPPGVTVIAARLGEHAPPSARALRMPSSGAQLAAQLVEAAALYGAPPKLGARIAARSRGSFLFVRLACSLAAAGVLRSAALPNGLEALHTRWWETLDAAGRRLALLLAAAAEPLELAHCAALARLEQEETARQLLRWGAILEQRGPADAYQIHHGATRAFIARQSGDRLAAAHAAHARYLLGSLEAAGGRAPAADDYLVRQLARHVALSDPATRAEHAPALESRAWVVAQERRTGSMRAAAEDLAWSLQAAARSGDTTPLHLARTAALAGTLTLLGRTLPPNAAAEAFAAAIASGSPRDTTLRRVQAILDQLPDGRDKAQALRHLGEVCYALRMRAPAMRMLSEALDLETNALPRSWRDGREETLVALARAAVAIGAYDTALGITTLITHAERRGMIDTEVVRRLLALGQHTRAEEVAYAISHSGTHEWAMAEVAVGHARAGDFERAGLVLDTLRTETAVAWVSAELACDAARRGNARAADRVALLRSVALRDRALSQVAFALGDAAMLAPARDAIAMIDDHEIRARALIGLAQRVPAAADALLAEAAAATQAITGDERAPTIAALAAAYAAVGQLDRGMQTAESLPPGEERDRARSRVAVALARSGAPDDALRVALAIDDDDERDWSLDELARIYAEARQWSAAFSTVSRIGDAEQRARTEADLAIAWARGGHPLEAHARAAQIPRLADRARALVAIAVPLVAAGARAAAHETLAGIAEADLRSRYGAALAAALAAAGDLDAALALAQSLARPLDRARAFVAVTRAAAAAEPARAKGVLGMALCETARLGRAETLTCLTWAADALALLGGAELLLNIASALDEIDGWWT